MTGQLQSGTTHDVVLSHFVSTSVTDCLHTLPFGTVSRLFLLSRSRGRAELSSLFSRTRGLGPNEALRSIELR